MKLNGFNFNFKIRVRWAEVDPQEIVFNAKYLEYGEITVSEYYRNLGIKLYNKTSREYFDTALVRATIEFKQSAKVEDILHIFSRITKIGKTQWEIMSKACQQWFMAYCHSQGSWNFTLQHILLYLQVPILRLL